MKTLTLVLTGVALIATAVAARVMTRRKSAESEAAPEHKTDLKSITNEHVYAESSFQKLDPIAVRAKHDSATIHPGFHQRGTKGAATKRFD